MWRPGFAPGSLNVVCMAHKVARGRFFSEFFRFPLSISFHRGSPHSCIVSGMDDKPVAGRSSEIVSRHRHEQQHTVLTRCEATLRSPCTALTTAMQLLQTKTSSQARRTLRTSAAAQKCSYDQNKPL
jgi:hypothetical protein